ncbi:AvrD family protein [Streptomyces dysideae]|uniref:Avirulence D protein (AvrD) n=1 Tax=Streptomyces dysideae TaxID=909626 RepID=A0A117S2T7_9ACTN|nr:AvrD family protein [Streptomyces dysideae]KUO22596.1 hypothetical protein AQJ91_03035 [Streptomyces dysideae]
MTETRLFVPAIEDYLGPGERRFFGGGFRRVEQRLRDIRVSCGPESTRLSAQASVNYPRDWSAKGSRAELAPHLSTIDALVLGARVSEILLVHAYGLDPGARSRMWLRRARVRAGGRPQEDLGTLSLRSAGHVAESVPIADGARVSRVESHIGSMTVACEVQHEEGGGYRSGVADVHHADADRALGEPYGQYFAELFRHRRQHIGHLLVDSAAGQVDASVRITPAPGEGPYFNTGMEAAYAPSASMIDAITVMGQLVQVLLYELDGIDRSGSDTLWLRLAELATDLPLRPLDGAFPVRTTIEDSRVLILAGDSWRVCDLGYAFHGITGTYSVAHRLPPRGL